MSNQAPETQQHQSSHLGLYTLFITAIMVWGGNWVAAKLIAVQADAGTNMVARFSLTILCFLVIMKLLRVPYKIDRINVLPVLAAGCCAAAYQWNFFHGLQVGYASYGGIIVTTLNPVLTHLVENILTRKAFTRREILGFIVAIMGMGIVIEAWTLDMDSLFQSGNFFFIIASIFWVGITIINHRIKIHPLRFVLYLNIPCVVIGLTLTTSQAIATAFMSGWVYLIPVGFLALFGTVFAATVNFHTVQVLGPKKATSFLFLIPAFAVLFSWLLLNEPLGWGLLVGGGLASCGIYLVNKS